MAGPLSPRTIAFSLSFIGLFLLLCFLCTSEVEAEVIHHPEGDETIVDIAIWQSDHVITGNLTVPDNALLIIEDGDLIFNTTTEGQFGLTIEPLGTLDITNGAIRGNNPIRFDIEGVLLARNSTLGEIHDEGIAHVNGGYLAWESGELPEGHLNLNSSLVELMNFTSATPEPTMWLDNSSVRLLNTTFSLANVRLDDNSSSIDVGYFVELTFHGLDPQGNPSDVPISKGLLSISWNGTLVRTARTNSLGLCGPFDLMTKQKVNGTWTFHNEYEFNFSVIDSWWSVWNHSLNYSISELINLGPQLSIADVSLINPGRSSDTILKGDSIIFRISITNKGNVWIKGNFQAKLMWYATRIAWINNTIILLEPHSSAILTFEWNATEVGNYALYLLFTSPLDAGEQSIIAEATAQKNVDVTKPVHEDPTFLGLGYEYWLVILPLLALLVAVAVAVIREERRLGKYRVEEVFLLDSIGRVIGHSSEGEGSLDEDIVGSMLTALQDFVAESFQAGGEAQEADGTDEEEAPQRLKRLEHGALMLLIEHGYHCFIVLVISGQDRPEIRRFMQVSLKDIEARFGPVLSNWDGDASKLEGAGEIVDELAQVKLSVRWKFDPRALIAGWKERHIGKRSRPPE